MATLQSRLVSGGQIDVNQVPTQLERGMTLLDKRGYNLGKVVAVLEMNKQLTHMLLGCKKEGSEEQQLEYRLIPVSLINRVTEVAISLELVKADLPGFPVHHPEPQ